MGITEIRVTHAEKDAIHIEWNTDISAAGSVIYGPTASYGAELVSGEISDHQELVVSGLECGTDYHLAVIASAPTGELSWSTPYVFATLACDSAEIDDIEISTSADAATISWTTDVEARGLVVFGPGTDYGSASLAPANATSQAVELQGLSCGTWYNARVATETDSGASSWTRNLVFQTAACPVEVPGEPGPPLVL